MMTNLRGLGDSQKPFVGKRIPQPTKGFPDPTHYPPTYENYVNVSGFALQKPFEDTPPTEENNGIHQSGISLGVDGLEF